MMLPAVSALLMVTLEDFMIAVWGLPGTSRSLQPNASLQLPLAPSQMTISVAPIPWTTLPIDGPEPMVPTGAPPPAKLTVVILSPLICRSCWKFSWNGGVELPGVPELGPLGLLIPSRAWNA
jgi:hypothetical protein